MDWVVVRIATIIAFVYRQVSLIVSILIALPLLALVTVVIILGKYEAWDKWTVAIASGVISSVLNTAFLPLIRWVGTKSSYFSEDILDVIGNVLWRKCLWDTVRARLRWQGYCRYEDQLFGGIMGKRVLIRAIYGNGKWNTQLVVGDEVVYGFGTGDDLGAIGKDREAALEDARRFAKTCGLSIKIENKIIEARVLENPTRNMFVIRSLLYRSANVLREESYRNPDGHENLIREVDEMLDLLDGARMYCAHGRWNRDERDDVVKSLMELIRKTMAVLPDHEYGKEPGSDRLVRDLKNELGGVEADLFSSAKKIVLAESSSRHETRLSRYRRRMSEAWRHLWSRLRGPR